VPATLIECWGRY